MLSVQRRDLVPVSPPPPVPCPTLSLGHNTLGFRKRLGSFFMRGARQRSKYMVRPGGEGELVTDSVVVGGDGGGRW